jgi:hypothetical protein
MRCGLPIHSLVSKAHRLKKAELSAIRQFRIHSWAALMTGSRLRLLVSRAIGCDYITSRNNRHDGYLVTDYLEKGSRRKDIITCRP